MLIKYTSKIYLSLAAAKVRKNIYFIANTTRKTSQYDQFVSKKEQSTNL